MASPFQTPQGAIGAGIQDWLSFRRQQRAQEQQLAAQLAAIAAQSFTGPDLANMLTSLGITPGPELSEVGNIPSSVATTFMQAALEPRLTGQDFLSLLPPQIQGIYEPDQLAQISGMERIAPSMAQEVLSRGTQLAMYQPPLMVPTTEEMRRVGLPERVTLDDFERLLQYYPSEDGLFDVPMEITNTLPFMRGKRVTLDQMVQLSDLAQKMEKLRVSQLETERVARETATFIAENQGKFVDPSQLRSFLQRNYPNTQFFFPEPIEEGPYKGKISFSQFLELNGDLVGIAETAANIGLVNTRIQGENLDNQLKSMQIETFYDRNRAEMDHLQALTRSIHVSADETEFFRDLKYQRMEQELANLRQQYRIDSLRADELERMLPFNLERAAQEIILGNLTIDRVRQEIANLVMQGQILQNEAEYLERTLDARIRNEELGVVERGANIDLIRARHMLTVQEAIRLEQLLPFELDEAAIRIARGQEEINKIRQEIANLHQSGRISKAEAEYLEATLSERIFQEELRTRDLQGQIELTDARIRSLEAGILETEQRIKNLQSEYKINEARLREMEALLPYTIQDAANRVLLGQLEAQEVTQRIYNLEQQGRISSTEALFLEETLQARIEALSLENQMRNMNILKTQSEIALNEQELSNLQADERYRWLQIEQLERMLPFTIEQAALNIARGQIEIEEVKQRIENLRRTGRISEMEAEFLERTLDLRVERERLQNQLMEYQNIITEAQARRADQMFEAALQEAQLKVEDLRQALERGETLYELEIKRQMAVIDQLLAQGDLTRAEAEYLRQTAPIRAALLEIEFQRGQHEMSEFQLALMWEFLGLPGEPPEGLKIYNYQLDNFIDLLRARPGQLVKLSSIMEMAGIDTSQLPEDLKNASFTVDGMGELINSLQGLQVSELRPINTYIDLALALLEAYAPDPINDLFTFLYLERNPESAHQFLAPRISKTPPAIQDAINRILEMGIRYTETQSSVLPEMSLQGGPSSIFQPQEDPVEDIINQILSVSGFDPEFAYRRALDPATREAVLSDPDSPFYQNPQLWNQVLERLRVMARGGNN